MQKILRHLLHPTSHATFFFFSPKSSSTSFHALKNTYSRRLYCNVAARKLFPHFLPLFFFYTKDRMSLFIMALHTLSLACAVAYPLRPPNSCQCQHFTAHWVGMYVLHFVSRHMILYLAELKATLCLNACRLPSNLYCPSYLRLHHYWPLCSLNEICTF